MSDVTWETPAWLFTDLHEEFGFTVDVCAEPWNAKVERYFSPEEDGIEQPWEGVCWMNPPYGRDLETWVTKAWTAAQCGATVVCLLPARTETAWFHEYVLGMNELDIGADEVRFIRRRLTFEGAAREARFASIVVVFRPNVERERRRPVVSAIDPENPEWPAEAIAGYDSVWVAPGAGVVLEGEAVRDA